MTPMTQRGQAAVESALILPVMTFMILGIIQLTMMQQAALMTEYAAFQACRAGIVWNGNNDKMVNAAEVALAPTIGKSSRLYPLGSSKITGLVEVGQNLVSLKGADAILGSITGGGLKIVRVDVVNPSTAVFNANVGKGLVVSNNNELVFDDVGYTSTDGHKDGFVANTAYRRALLLTIRLRYLYQLRVPFANWIIQTCFFAAQSTHFGLSGMLGGESMTIKAGGFEINHKSAAETGDQVTAAGATAADATAISWARGKPTLTKAEFLELYALRRLGGVILLPLNASYTMRMQSNFYRKNLTN